MVDGGSDWLQFEKALGNFFVQLGPNERPARVTDESASANLLLSVETLLAHVSQSQHRKNTAGKGDGQTVSGSCSLQSFSKAILEALPLGRWLSGSSAAKSTL